MSFGSSGGTDGMMDRVFTLDRELQNLKLKNSMLQEFADNLKQQLQESEAALQKSRNDFYEVSQSRDSLLHEIEALKEEIEKLKKEKIEIFELLKEKNQEIAALKDALRNYQSNNVLEVEQSKNSSLNEIRLRFLENRMKEERNLFQSQIQLLNQELENKTNELLNARKESNEKSLEANLKIEDQTDEITDMKSEISRLKKLNESKSAKNDELSNKLVELQLHCTKLESTYNKETGAQDDIINMLMKGVEDKEKKAKNQEEKIVELRELLKKGCDAHSELELQFESMKENYRKDVKELEEERQMLSEELEQAKMNLTEFNKTVVEKQFEKYFPLASQTNSKLNNVVNLSDLYDELVKTKQELTRTTATNLKLEKEIKELSERVDEDKPLLYENIHEYEKMEQNYARLHEELMQLLMEKDKYMSEKDVDTQTINTLKREIKRYQQETSDLSLQVAYLMKNLHEANGFVVCDDLSENAQLNSSNNLILFKDIRELQEKNRQLLSLLNEMNEELQNKEMSDENPREAKLKLEIQTYKKDIENLRSELDQKNEIIELSAKQKRLMNPNYPAEMDPIEIIGENKELKAKIEQYVDDLQNVRQQNIEDVRRLEKDKNELIMENANIKSDLSRLNSELRTLGNQMDELNSTYEKYQNENVSLRERNIKLNSTVENLEKNIIMLNNQIEQLNETIKMKDSNVDFCKTEALNLKNEVEYLIKENGRLNQEVSNQMKLVQSLKMMQDNCNRIETKTIQNQFAQIERAEKEIAYYRDKIAKQEEKWKEQTEQFTKRLHGLQEMLDKERDRYLQMQQENFELKMKLQSRQQPTIQETMMDTATEQETSPSVLMGGNVKKELQVAQDEIKVLKGKLINSEEKCQNLESINVVLEENLNKLVQNNNEIKTNIDSEIQNKLDTINGLNQEMQNLREQYEKIVAEKNAEIDRLKQTNEAYEKQLQKLQLELNDLKQALEKAHHNEKEVLNDIKIQSLIAAKTQQDYENSLELRNKNAQTIFELQVKLDAAEKRRSEQEIEIEKLREELKSNMEILENERTTLKQECEKLRIRCGKLEQVNDSLSNQIEQLNDQIIALQNNSNMFILDENQQKENANHLLAVVKFLREEKAQLQLELSKINDENMCLKIEIENYRKEIENLKSLLQMEKESSNHLNNLNEFKDIVSKAQMVPVLSENNAHLKIQVGQLEKKCNELSEKLKEFENKEKSLQDLSQKAENEEFQVEFLRKEVENWKSKATALQQQLKNFEPDSVKRLMNEKTILGKQVQVNHSEMNKVRLDLENKTRALMVSEQELNNLRQQNKQLLEQKNSIGQNLDKAKNEVSHLQNVTNQLRQLARKYKAEIGKIKSSDNGTGAGGATNKMSDPSEISDKEVQCDLSQTEKNVLENSERLVQEYQAKIERMHNDVESLNQENESWKKKASEKDVLAKKIAQQAKQRISDLSVEKSNLIKEKENLVQTIDELRIRVFQLENNSEQNVNQLKNQYDSQITQQQKELQMANRQIEDLTTKLKQPPVGQSSKDPIVPLASTSGNSNGGSSTSKTTNASLSATPLRHSVLPQQQPSTSSTTLVFSSKAMVSIKPMTVSVPPNSRLAQVVGKIVPTESQTSSSSSSTTPSVPQATVQPTQAISISNASSTSVSSSSIPTTSNIDVVEVSEASSQTHPNNINIASKRTLDNSSFDEPSSSNYKKAKSSVSNVVADESDDDDDDENDYAEMNDPNEQRADESNRGEQYDLNLMEESQDNEECNEDSSEDTESQAKNQQANVGLIGDEVDDMMMGDLDDNDDDDDNNNHENEDEQPENDEDEEEDDDDDGGADDDDDDDDNEESELGDEDQIRSSGDEGDRSSLCLYDDEDMDEEEEDEEDEDDQDDDDDDDVLNDEEPGNPEIEVIELNSDSSEDEHDSNMATSENLSEVTSSYVPSNQKTVRQDLATTTQNEDSNDARRMNPSGAVDAVTSQSNSSSRVFDSEAVVSQTSSTTTTTSQQPQQNPQNVSEMATSSTTNNIQQSSQVNRQPRKPVLWHTPNRDIPSGSGIRHNRGGVIQHGQQHGGHINANRGGPPRGGINRGSRRGVRGIDRNRRNFRFQRKDI